MRRGKYCLTSPINNLISEFPAFLLQLEPFLQPKTYSTSLITQLLPFLNVSKLKFTPDPMSHFLHMQLQASTGFQCWPVVCSDETFTVLWVSSELGGCSEPKD